MGGAGIRSMERRARGHAAQRKDLQLLALAVQIGLGFVPIDLRFLAPGVLLRHAHLRARPQPESLLPLTHVLAHRRLGDPIARPLLADAHPDAMRGVALLARATEPSICSTIAPPRCSPAGCGATLAWRS